MLALPDLLGRIGGMLHQKEGRLSRELALEDSPLGLGRLPERLQPEQVTSLVCGFCSTGCALNVHIRDGKPVNLSPTPDYPVNQGMACPKGWESLAPLAAPDRAISPMLRGEDGVLREVGWHAAMLAFVQRFKAVQEKHGKASVAYISTGQITTEEMALLGAVAKFGMGMIHGDGNTRQCMATSVAAYKASFGFDAPPYTYADLELSDTLVFIGANPCIAHPILWERVLRNPHKPAIIVLDPRKTETAMAATHHYAILPKSDLTLLYALAGVLIEKGWIDNDFIARSTLGASSFVSRTGVTGRSSGRSMAS